MARKEFVEQKEYIMKELAKLERLDWAKDDVTASSIFPYVLIEAINILKNSTIVKRPVDYCKTSNDVNIMISNLIKKENE